MDIGNLSTIVGIAKNVSFDFELPSYKVLAKNQVRKIFRKISKDNFMIKELKIINI